MSNDYNIPTFLGKEKTDSTKVRATEYASAVRQATVLVREGILHPDFVRRVQNPEPNNHVLTFCNTVNGEELCASIVYDHLREDNKDPAFTLRIFMTSAVTEDGGTVSVSQGDDLKALVLRGKSLIMAYNKPAAPAPVPAPVPEPVHQRKTKDALLQVRIDPDLKKQFEDAVADADESQARIIRKLIQYYLGKGPDPKLSK